jgi:hypothetical protein
MRRFKLLEGTLHAQSAVAGTTFATLSTVFTCRPGHHVADSMGGRRCRHAARVQSNKRPEPQPEDSSEPRRPVRLLAMLFCLFASLGKRAFAAYLVGPACLLGTLSAVCFCICISDSR